MTRIYTPPRTVKVDGYVFASPEMRGIRNKRGKPWTRRTIFAYNVEQVLYKHNKWHAKRDKTVSNLTKQHRFVECRAMAHDLHNLGFKIMLPTAIRQKHVKALTHYWESKGDLKPSTILQKVSILRTFLGWIGRSIVIDQLTPADMFTEPEKFKRSLVADKDKSWDPVSDPVEVIERVMEKDRRVGSQLMLSHLFGLRPKETWCFKPRRDYDKEQRLIHIREGSKGGRPRTVPVVTQKQRDFLESLIELAYETSGSLIPPYKTLKAWKSHYYRITRECGVSRKNGLVPHGLRHGYAHAVYQQYSGHPAAVKATKKAEDFDAVQERIARLIVSEQLGHNRESITSAYTGNYK